MSRAARIRPAYDFGCSRIIRSFHVVVSVAPVMAGMPIQQSPADLVDPFLDEKEAGPSRPGVRSVDPLGQQIDKYLVQPGTTKSIE